MTESNQNEEKIWEKPWNFKDLHSNSTTWSLAGDAGLLLQLKQFSENMISKAILIEKKLQDLAFQEQRVYEEDLTEAKPNLEEKNKPPEKSKEEKEQDLFVKINDAVNIGMSIMDNYFDKINSKELKMESDSDVDEDEENIEKDLKKQNDAEELIIYETKDPYVLHSLPYLIGSKLYLENDHVGLKDLDSEEEEDDEEEEEEIEVENDLNSLNSSMEKAEKEENKFYSSDSSDESSEKSDVFGISNRKNNQVDLDENSEDDSDNNSLDNNKNVKKQNTDNLFSDDDEKLDEKKVENIESDEENERLVENKPKKEVLDFTAELSSRLASKKNQNDKKNDIETKIVKEVVKEVNTVPKKTKTLGLFDDTSDEEETSIFARKPQPKVESVSEDSDSDNKVVKTINKNDEIKTKLSQKQDSIKNDIDSSDENDIFQKKTEQKPNIIQKEKKFSIFDDDDDEDLLEAISSKKSEKVSNLFDKNEAAENLKPTTTKVKTSLFDDLDEKEEEKNEVEEKKIPEIKSKTNIKPQNLLFDPAALKSSGLFTKMSETTKNESKETDEESLSFSIPDNNNKNQTLNNALSKPSINISETKKKTSLFDDNSDDDELFQGFNSKTKNDQTNVKENNLNKSSLITSDDKITMNNQTKPIQTTVNQTNDITKNISVKKSLFDNSSDEDNEDSLFNTKKSTSKVQISTTNNSIGVVTSSNSSKIILETTENKFEVPVSKTNDIFEKSLPEKNNSETVSKPKQDQNKNTDSIDDLFNNASNKTPSQNAIKPEENLFSSEQNILKKDIKQEPVNKYFDSDEKNLFEGIKPDRSFSEMSFKNVQKDRIKISAKKRAPTQRPKKNMDENDDILFESPPVIEDNDNSNNDKILNEEKPIETKKENQNAKLNPIGKNLLFDPSALKSSGLFKKALNNQNNQSEESKNETNSTTIKTNLNEDKLKVTKKEKNFDDDDDDLFSVKKSSKLIDPNPTVMDDNLFDSKISKNETSNKIKSKIEEDDFVEDLFKPVQKNEEKLANKKKSNLSNIFDDDIFSDLSLTNNASKKAPLTGSTEKSNNNTNAKNREEKSNKNILFDEDDIFGDLNNDELLFKQNKNKPKKKIIENQTKSDDFEDPLLKDF